MKEESLLLLSDLQKLINQVVLIDYTIIILGGASVMADTEKIIRKKYDVPIWHKSNLTIDEAVEYSGIGRERLRKLTSQEECPFVLHIGNRRMIKRRIFDEYIEKLTFLE